MLFSLKALPLAVLATSIYHFASTVHAVRTLSELFDVSFDATVGGNCAAIGSARMQAMLDDAHDLALAGIAMVTAANDQNNPLYAEAVRNLDAWFESPFLDAVQYDIVGDVYTAVDDWIEGRITNVDGGKSSLKPLLICGDNSFVLRQSMTDQAWGFDQNNNQVRLTHNDNSPFRIRDSQEYVNKQAAASQVLGQQTYPYWISRLGLYIFDKMYGPTQQPTDYVCAGETTGPPNIPHGLTKGWPAPKPNLVILCPTAFRNAGRRTHSVAVNCLDATQLVNTRPPAGVTGITNVIGITPDGATLFHEMIHLILGIDATKPPTGEEYVPSKLLGKVPRQSGQVMTSAEAFANPETYMYAAAGFDYSLSAPKFNDHIVEFYTGWCTFQT